MLLCGNCSSHMGLVSIAAAAQLRRRPTGRSEETEVQDEDYDSSDCSPSSSGSGVCDERRVYAQQKCKEALDEWHEKAIVSSVVDSLASTIAVSPSQDSGVPLPRSKVIVLGNSGVGKTSIIYNHKYGSGLLPCNATIGASYMNFDLTVDDDPIQLQVWDTAGQERFRCMVPMYMRNADAAILVYDITERKSFDEIEKWLTEISRCTNFEDPIMVLIGNKADMSVHREVAEGEGILKASKLNAKFFEISALDTQGFTSAAPPQLLADLSAVFSAAPLAVLPCSEILPIIEVGTSTEIQTFLKVGGISQVAGIQIKKDLVKTTQIQIFMD